MSNDLGEHWVINAPDKLSNFLRHVQTMFSEHKYLVATVRHGQQRSLGQNALWAIWARDYIAPYAGLTEEQARLAMYHMFRGYADIRVSDKLTIPNQLKRSPKDWRDMYAFMRQVQEFWAGRGLFLESRGEYAENQRKEAA